MMKKKGLILLLAVSVFAFTGCGKQNTTEETGEVSVEFGALEVADDIEASEVETEEPTTRIVDQAEEISEETTTEVDNSASDSGVTAISPEDATAMLMVTLGERDEQTGNEYSYGYIENVQIDGVTYLVFDWRWLVDDHMSKLTDLFVTADGTKIYEGLYKGPEDSEVYLENPLN
ncbi:MAG: hypothetical protein ACI4F4_01335 [Lachnospiraceae bacterium]